MIPIIAIILSFGLPIYILINNYSGKHLNHPYLISIASFTACSSGIIAELLTINKRLINHDIGGIEDTIGAVIIISIIMLVVTIVLNFLALGSSYEQ